MGHADSGLALAVLAARNGFISEAQLRDITLELSRPGSRPASELLSGAGLSAADLELLKSVAGARRRADATVAGPETVVPGRGEAPQKREPAPDRGLRYLLGDEIGRGGLGRVVEAFDRDLDRDVAIKLLLDAGSTDLADRFEREARITARLDHPNIVPVHDFGELRGGDGRRLFLCMKRIRGRDLATILSGLGRGDAALAAEWTRPRLLRVFQDVCLGVAYAHSKGVIHRDLKPANVMVGEFGETFVVDWGLAKVVGPASPRTAWSSGQTRVIPLSGAPGDPATSGPSSVPPADLTFSGDVLGTPAYMSPEQAEGRSEDMSPASDVYSLGAILFEILTLTPAFTGKSALEILGSVVSGPVPVPSSRAPVPPELDSLVLRAMSSDPAGRHPSALALHSEIQLFLEGVTTRERRAADARAAAGSGEAALKRWRTLRPQIRAAADRVQELLPSLGGAIPLQKKQPLWAAEAAHRALTDSRLEAFAEADAKFAEALSLDEACGAAREGKCSLEFEGYVEAEAERDRERMVRHRIALAQHDKGGAFGRRLSAPGSLTVRAWEWPCDCLAPAGKGWRVTTQLEVETEWRDGRARPGEPATKAGRPVPVIALEGGRFGHRPECRPREIHGAEVWGAPLVERERRLVPGELRLLGTTPLERLSLPQGSWHAVVRSPGRETPFPFVVTRDGSWVQDVRLYDSSLVPPGYLQVPGGPFTFGGRFAGGLEEQPLVTEDFFVARHPVTAGEYLEFLNALAAEGRLEEAREAAPLDGLGPLWIEQNGRFSLPARDERRKWTWTPDCPVFMVSWANGVAYADWRSRHEGRLFTLLHEVEWEKAARGVDARIYPYGWDFDGAYSHTAASGEDWKHFSPVGSFPRDISPYGAVGMSGGMSTWCLSRMRAPSDAYQAVRGGCWIGLPSASRTAATSGWTRSSRNWMVGLRLAFRPLAWPEKS